MPHAYFYGRVSHADGADRVHAGSDTCKSVDHQFAMAQKRFEYDLSQGKLPPGTTWAHTGWIGRKTTGHATTDGRYVDEEVSAYTFEFKVRPAGRRLHEVLKPGDTLYITYLERGFRNWRDFAAMLDYWSKNKIRVVFISPELDLSTWTGEMVAAILSICAWLQSTLMSEKLKEQAATRRARGWKNGCHAPMGFKYVNKRLQPDDEVREMRLRIVALREQGLTFKEIAAAINNPQWDRGRCQKVFNACEISLPSHMLPPGTFDRPLSTEEKKALRAQRKREDRYDARRRQAAKLRGDRPVTKHLSAQEQRQRAAEKKRLRDEKLIRDLRAGRRDDAA